jgi:hypothetical protein
MDRLTVKGLKSGTYALQIDGETVVSGSATDWATGLPITNSPTHKALADYQALVNDKNLQWVYSWKALNQVHIVGERKKSASGKELPGEVIEFAKLARERDAKLQSGLSLKTRQWRLVKQ